jgi:16S rRNA (guanine527-N7)-methyltransferase
VTDEESRHAIAADVSRETLERLELYRTLLLKWQSTVNLVSPATIDAIWSRHFHDSFQLLSAIDRNAKHWVDLGSGAGFPGLVCAIAARDRPDPPIFSLVESDTRKCAFLREVSRATNTPVTILNARAESIPPLDAHVVSARALAPLTRLLPLVHRHVAPDGAALLQKGVRYAQELELARRDWQMDVDVLRSSTDADAVILRFRNLTHA